MEYLYISAIVVGLLSCVLIKYYFGNNNTRSLPLVRSFQDYANNYTYTCDGFAADFVRQHIDNETKNVKSGNLLVIGAGPKPMIDELIKVFDKIYLIDPNGIWHEQWTNLWWYHNPDIYKIKDTFDNIDKYLNHKQITFEWMIASHVFYYIKHQDLGNHIELINKYLDKYDGKIIISVTKDGECDGAKLCSYIQPEYALCENITKSLIENNMKYIEIKATNEGDMEPQNKSTLLNILTMHLNDFIIGNDEYKHVITMDQDVLKRKVANWMDVNMKVDPEDENNVIYHQHTAHYVVSKLKG